MRWPTFNKKTFIFYPPQYISAGHSKILFFFDVMISRDYTNHMNKILLYVISTPRDKFFIIVITVVINIIIIMIIVLDD